MQELITRCNVCKIIKGERNHWYTGQVYLIEDPNDKNWVHEVRIGTAGMYKGADICSDKCALDYIKAWISQNRDIRVAKEN